MYSLIGRRGLACECHVGVGLVAWRQAAEKLPSLGANLGIGLEFKAAAAPVGGGFGAGVEVVRLIEDGEVMVPHEHRLAVVHDQVEALAWVRAVPNDVAKAEDIGNAAFLDIGPGQRSSASRFECMSLMIANIPVCPCGNPLLMPSRSELAASAGAIRSHVPRDGDVTSECRKRQRGMCPGRGIGRWRRAIPRLRGALQCHGGRGRRAGVG